MVENVLIVEQNRRHFGDAMEMEIIFVMLVDFITKWTDIIDR